MEVVLEQLEVLRSFTERLEKLGIPYMLTGSMALSNYSIPRSTLDIDIVLVMSAAMLPAFIEEFDNDFYIPVGSATNAVSRSSMFNVINSKSLVKVDCILLKADDFERTAFARRQRVNYGGDFDVWLISKEDLIVSKLIWSKKSGSERQLDDVAGLMQNQYDEAYVEHWVNEIDLGAQYEKSQRRAGI